ncbi:hypothetical protein ACOMHN_009531 [Nucella lapillus]
MMDVSGGNAGRVGGSGGNDDVLGGSGGNAGRGRGQEVMLDVVGGQEVMLDVLGGQEESRCGPALHGVSASSVSASTATVPSLATCPHVTTGHGYFRTGESPGYF